MDGVTANLEHGGYLVEHIAHCVECHSPRDENGNIIEAREFDADLFLMMIENFR